MLTESNKKSIGKKAAIIVIAVFVVLAIGAAAFFRIGDKFHDATAEAGTQQIAIDDFLAGKAYKSFSRIVSSAGVDLNKAGDYPVTLSMAGKEETVTLHVVDTTPPTVELRDVTEFIGYEADVKDFIVSMDDYSALTASFVGSAPDTSEISARDIEISVKDAFGNETIKTSRLVISWLKGQADIQIGDTDFISKLVADPETDAERIPAEELQKVDITKLGEYEFSVDYEGSKFVCRVNVIDTIAPTLKLKNISVYNDDTRAFKAEDFIASMTDNSGEAKAAMLSTLTFSGTGTQNVTISATDPSGNTTEATATYTRKRDTEAPKLNGLTDLTVKKKAKVDYRKGVTVTDNNDKNVTYSVDSSKVNLTKPGTYFAVYSATDKAGNKVVKNRRIEVMHDAEDTKALVAEMAKKCGSSVDSVRSFVLNEIRYRTYDGGSDPVWYGFTSFNGNCIVHAKCYQALLNAKGYKTMLIWTTDKSHYWVLVYTKGRWWHTDATPGVKHTPMPVLATDEQRYEHLQGRDWDRTKWPECP